VHVLGPAALTDAQHAELTSLLVRRTKADAHPALPEPLQAAIDGSSGELTPDILLAYHDAGLVGAAILAPAHDGSRSLHLVIDTSHDRDEAAGIRSFLMDSALAAAGASQPIRLWAMQADADDDANAAAYGFTPERDVIQMRVALPLPPDIIASARSVETRPFVPGRDDEAWIDVNNRAFAGHPEQGDWTLAQLHERLRADWVDVNGFLMAEAPDGSGVIGSCWTKVHRAAHPVLGEIYIISVDPERHGQGWGKAMTVAGLVWLAAQGISVGMLYTDSDNAAAIALYSALGFTVDHADRSYLLAPSASLRTPSAS
jgi:mycothiol synthase